MGTQAAAGREHTVVTSPLGELTLVRDGAAIGKLTGYAGGLPRKRALLELEREHTDAPAQVSLLPGTWPAMPPGS